MTSSFVCFFDFLRGFSVVVDGSGLGSGTSIVLVELACFLFLFFDARLGLVVVAEGMMAGESVQCYVSEWLNTADHPELFSMERAPTDNDKDERSRELGAAESHDQGFFGMVVLGV